MQLIEPTGPGRPGPWTLLARLRRLRRKHGAASCRREGIGGARKELELMLAETVEIDARAEQRAELMALESECRKCELICKLARK